MKFKIGDTVRISSCKSLHIKHTDNLQNVVLPRTGKVRRIENISSLFWTHAKHPHIAIVLDSSVFNFPEEVLTKID